MWVDSPPEASLRQEPSPRGAFPVVVLKGSGGSWASPFTWRLPSFVALVKSVHTFSRDCTLWLVREIEFGELPPLSLWVFSGVFKNHGPARLPDQLVRWQKPTAVSQE